MNRQKSFENEQSTLYLVPTPIGNLSEMSPRAVEVLNSVDVIACEDTRTSGTLLKHFDIHAKLIACHNFNEENSAKGILSLLEEGKNVAMISDAGYPLINDPGQRVVSDVTEHGFNVSLSQFSAAMKLFDGFYETEYKEFVIDAVADESLTLHLNSYNVHIDEAVQDTVPGITGKIGVRGPNMETVIDAMLKENQDDARMYFDEYEARSLACTVDDEYFFIFGTIGDYSSEM